MTYIPIAIKNPQEYLNRPISSESLNFFTLKSERRFRVWSKKGLDLTTVPQTKFVIFEFL